MSSLVGVTKKSLRGLIEVEPDFKVNKVARLASTKRYKPVYRIAITYPVKEFTSFGAYTEIVADTSTSTTSIQNPVNKYFSRSIGMGISDMLGLWVDNSDTAEPDKAVVLFRVDPKLTTKSLLGNKAIEDEYFSFYNLFAVRNWIDIWVGYETEPDIQQKVPVGTSGNKLFSTTGNLQPEGFTWHGETHLFGGPISLVDRTISRNGDRISITALSPEIILKETKVSGIINKGFTIEHRTAPGAENKYFKDALLELFESIISQSRWTEIKKQKTDLFSTYFVIGDFQWELFKDTIDDMKQLIKTNGRTYRKGDYPLLEKLVNPDIFTQNDKYKMKAPLVLTNQPSWWDCMLELLKPERSNLVGLGFRLLKYRSKSDGKYNSVVNGTKGLVTGQGHKGVFFQFYFEMDVEEQVALNRRNKNFIPENNFQGVTLGDDIIDLEAYIDYSTVFNTFRIMTQTPQTEKGSRYDTTPHEVTFPLDHEEVIDNLGSSPIVKPLKQFWKDVLKDIQIYGEQRFPVAKWFAITAKDLDLVRESLEFGSSLSPEARELLITGEVQLSSIAGHYGIAGMFKRYYYGGLEGSVYCIGNPGLKAGRLLKINDARNAMSTALKESFHISDQADSVSNNIFAGFNKTVKSPNRVGIPLNLDTRFKDPTNKYFWIWKVRHYLGPKSGFLTKAYFTQSRSRSWRMATRDISDLFKQTYRIAREIT